MKTVALITALLCIFISKDAIGCTCKGDTSYQKGITTTDLIFKGKVVSIDSIVLDIVSRDTLFTLRVSFSVNHVFKDLVYVSSKENFYLQTGLGHGDCGFPFVLGESYLVFANIEVYENTGSIEFNTDVCTNTRLYTENEEYRLMTNLKAETKKKHHAIRADMVFLGEIKKIDTLKVKTAYYPYVKKKLLVLFKPKKLYKKKVSKKNAEFLALIPLDSCLSECELKFNQSYFVTLYKFPYNEYGAPFFTNKNIGILEYDEKCKEQIDLLFK